MAATARRKNANSGLANLGKALEGALSPPVETFWEMKNGRETFNLVQWRWLFHSDYEKAGALFALPASPADLCYPIGCARRKEF